MFRKLIALALLAGGIAALIKKQGAAQSSDSAPSPAAATPEPAPASEPAAQASEPVDEDLAEVRAGQTEDTVESPVLDADGEEAVIPDVSDDDPLVREQENAAAAEARAVGGGEPEPLSPDLDPELEPVIEASGDDPETLEKEIEEGGR